MKDGLCPKCGSEAVYVRKNDRTIYGVGAIMLKDGVFSTGAPLDNYVCGDCGYVESYLVDKEKLGFVTEHWDRVNDGERGETHRLPPLPE
jgi:ribosomal protein S27AE